MKRKKYFSYNPTDNKAWKVKYSAQAVAAVCLGVTVLSSSLPARAQMLEEVIVTARKQAESMQDIPVAVSSFSGETLKEAGLRDINDLTFHAPNMTFAMSASSGSTAILSIRGQSQNDNVPTLDASVGMYVDDVIWARPIGANMTLADIASVEVLRGPQGTLFGRNTTGGAVLVHTNDPVFATEARVGVNIGNYNRHDGNFMVNLPLIDDKLAFRFAYDAEKRDGWQENTQDGAKTGEKDIQSFIAKFLFTPTDNLKMLLKLDRNEGDFFMATQTMTYFDAANGAPAFGGADPYAVFSGGAESYLDYLSLDYEHPSNNSSTRAHTAWKHEGASLATTWELDSGITVKAIGAYRELEENTVDSDYDNSPYEILTVDIGISGHHMWSGELQVSGTSFADKLDWTVGLFAFEESALSHSTSKFSAPVQQQSIGQIDNTSQAIFAQGNYHFTDRLTATLGLRYSEESKDLESMNNYVNSADGSFAFCTVPSTFTGGNQFIPGDCSAKFSRDDDSVDYSVMLTYDLSDSKMVYLRTATGFRSGGQNLRGGLAPPLTDSALAQQSFSSFEPETLTEYEIGLKAEWFDSRLRTNLAYFYDDYEDIQRSTLIAAGGVPVTVVANAAAGTVQGIEAELNGFVTDHWQAGATFGWIDAKYDTYNDFDSAGNPIDRSNEPFHNTAKYSYSLWTSYNIAMPVGELTLRADYSWHDEMFKFATRRTTGSNTPAEGMVNARVQWDINDNVEIAMWGKNLTNNIYRRYGIELLDNFGYAVGFGTDPRMYGLEVTYKFMQ